jgi:hypothetical protein
MQTTNILYLNSVDQLLSRSYKHTMVGLWLFCQLWDEDTKEGHSVTKQER